METESSEIIELLRRGDQQVLVDLWDQHRERLLRLVKLRMDRRMQGRVDSSDVLQEAFVDFAARAEEYAKDPSDAVLSLVAISDGTAIAVAASASSRNDDARRRSGGLAFIVAPCLRRPAFLSRLSYWGDSRR